MSTSNFPTSLDTYVNPASTDNVNAVPHHTQHTLANDSLAAIETVVGITGSADTTSINYKLSGVPATDKAASKTGTETLTNKTLTNPTIAGGTHTGTQDFTGATVNVKDSTFSIKDDVDSTKVVQFQVSGITTGNTRTLTVPDANTTIVGNDTTQTLTNKTINASNNTVSNITTGMFATNVVDTDGTLTANSDTRIASQKATKTYIDNVSSGGGLIATFTSPVTVTAASDTNILSTTIAGGTLSTAFMVKGKINLSNIFNSSGGAVSYTIKLKYGGSTVATITAPAQTGGKTWIGTLFFELYGNGGTSSQLGALNLISSSSGSEPSGLSSIPLSQQASGTSAVDSTSPQTLSITWAWASTTNSPTVTAQSGYVSK